MATNQGIPAKERFWMKVDKREEDECWEWIASYVGGYGNFRVNGKHVAAHRYSYELVHGGIPGEMFICHHCDNKRCVNPKHLFLGTHQDNVDDKMRKGRARGGSNKGDSHGKGNAKLTSEQVAEIKKMLDNGIMGTVIAKQFFVHKQTVYHIKAGNTWNI